MDYNNHKIRLIFIGTAEFGIPSFTILMNDPQFEIILAITQPDKPAGRKQLLYPSPIKLTAQKYKIPLVQPRKIMDLIEDIRRRRPDIVLVIAYSQLIPESILNLPRYGCLNLHASLLPKYRGAAPIQAAIFNRDEKTGLTVIKMDKNLDTGPILAQVTVPIDKHDNGETLYDKLAEVGSKLLPNTIKNYLSGEIMPVPQDKASASYAKRIVKSDGLVDWHKPAEAIEAFVRAMTPWPLAWTWWKGKQVKIIEVQPKPIEIDLYKPGKTFIYNRGLAIQCGKNALIIRRLQLEGKNILSSQEFLNGHKDFVGSILG